jgi:hypothetical protein
MGIKNINILTEIKWADTTQRLIQATRKEDLIIDHHKGKHPWGSMRRDCSLCQAGKELIR